MKANKILLIGGISALVIGGGFLVYQYVIKPNKDKKKSGTPDPSPPASGGSGGGSTSTALSNSFPIKFGTYNNSNVALLQKAIKVTADGDWGKITESKMKELGSPNKTFNSKTELDQFIFDKSFKTSEDAPTYYVLP